MESWISSSFDTTSVFKELPVDCKSKKRKLSSQSYVDETDDETWVQRYVPKVMEDLAVHKKKILEVEKWLIENMVANRSGAALLLLTGPSGCGKTATLKVVAKKHKVYIEEWNNPLTTPFAVSRQVGLHHQSESSRFKEFLFFSGKYSSVICDKNNKLNENSCQSNKIVLLEDLPNFLYHDPPSIVNLLKEYQRTQRWPLVLILSDGVISESLRRQLRNLSVKPFSINFNSISSSLMSKALSRICAVERRVLSKDDIAMISSCGDIRAAINCLQFSSQPDTLKRRKVFKTSSSFLAAKDTTMILFRALGKIFYCKREKQKVAQSKTQLPNLPEIAYRDPMVVAPETILEQCCLSGHSFSLFLHQNYLNFFESNVLNDVMSASDYLSVGDLVNSNLSFSDPSSGAAVYTDYYEGILAARGLVYSNSMRATSSLCSSSSGSWRPMHKPSWYNVQKQKQENSITSYNLFWQHKEDLHMLIHLAPKFDTTQRNFIREVIAISKWKSFQSCSDRLHEAEVGSEAPESVEISACDVQLKTEDEDDFLIEDFSD